MKMTEVFKKWFDGQIDGDNVSNGALTADTAWMILKSGKDNVYNDQFNFYSTMFINLVKRNFNLLTLKQTKWLTDNLPQEFHRYEHN